MLKQVLLATSMLVASPVLAQTATATRQTPPTASTAPTGDALTAQTSPATPAPTAPANPVVQSQPVTPATPDAAAPAATAQAEPATGATQVAQIVDREFPAYDKDGDGKLSQTEFSAWMVALKTASDPATKADSPATKQWVGAAFAQADTDKSRALSKGELTGFLSQGQS